MQQVKIAHRNHPAEFEEKPPKKGVETLKTMDCFVCGTSKCYNGTTVTHEGSKFLIRVCNSDVCRAAVNTTEGILAIKAKNLLTTPSQDKITPVSRTQKQVKKDIDSELTI